MRKKPKRPLTTRWCRAALGFLDVTVRFLQQGPRALIPHHVLRDERLASIASPCATKHPALELLPGTRLASTCFPPECDLQRGGRLGPSHPDHIISACALFSQLLKRNKTWGTSEPAAGPLIRSTTRWHHVWRLQGFGACRSRRVRCAVRH